jgi:putative SOS response-associated peptidase YedK
MCGRYSNTGKKGDDFQVRMAQLLGAPQPESDHGYGRFNIAPTQEVLVAVDDEHGRRMEHLRWGLIRGRTTDANSRFQMINARAESLLDRPAYRDLVQRAEHRCLVLADGWYEWQRPEDPKLQRRPLHFSLADGRPFCFAGLWSAGASPSCTIVTCAANDIARPIHDRMPVVLPDAAQWDAWLDPALDGTAVSELLAPLASERLAVRPAHPCVNSSTNEGPECLAAAAPDPPMQLRLSG